MLRQKKMEGKMGKFEEKIASPEITLLMLVVHDGQAHVDERVACAVLTAYVKKIRKDLPVAVVRTREKVVETPGTLVVHLDTGLRYDGNFWFDHHQKDDPRVAKECAATLVVDRFMPVLRQHPEFSKYLERIRIQDTEGLANASKTYGNEEPYPFMMEEFFACREFENDPDGSNARLTATVAAYEKQACEYKARLQWLRDNSSVRKINGIKVLVYGPETETTVKGTDQGLMRLVNSTLIEESAIDAVVSFDTENSEEGCVYRFFRTYYGAAAIDFNRVTDIPGGSVKFCHSNGFLLLVKGYNRKMETLENIIKQSIGE